MKITKFDVREHIAGCTNDEIVDYILDSSFYSEDIINILGKLRSIVEKNIYDYNPNMKYYETAERQLHQKTLFGVGQSN